MAYAPGSISKALGGVDSAAGPIVVPTLDNTFFELSMTNASKTADGVYHLYKDGAVYSPSGVTCVCEIATHIGSTTAIYWQLFYADNNFTDAAAAGTLTNPKYQGGASASYVMSTAGTTYLAKVESIIFTVPSGKYVGIQVASSAQSYQIRIKAREY